MFLSEESSLSCRGSDRSDPKSGHICIIIPSLYFLCFLGSSQGKGAWLKDVSTYAQHTSCECVAQPVPWQCNHSCLACLLASAYNSSTDQCTGTNGRPSHPCGKLMPQRGAKVHFIYCRWTELLS
jgi:hypothetical protein